jgi:hypothetical protein
LVVYNRGAMGHVTRGAVAVLVVLLLSGSVTPAITVADQTVETEQVGSLTGADGQPIATERRRPPGDAADGAPGRIRPTGSVAGDARQQTGDTIRLTQEFRRLPDRPGTVRVRLVYRIPDPVVSLQAELPDETELVESEGFDRTNETHLRWTGTTRGPTLTYDLAVNETIDRTGPQAADGRYLYADTDNWSLFERPSTPTYWEAVGGTSFAFERRSSTDGPGAAGQWLVFLGAHEVHERTAHGQQFRLVVPADANTSEPPSAILDALASGSDALRVGDRDESVFLVAAPTGTVAWGVRGLQTGDSDVWVRDGERLDEPDNAWLHEYVHTRQDFTPTGDTLWFREASASYYAALLSLEQETVEFERFRDRLAEGAEPRYDGAVLSNVSTWQADPDYHRGALVAGELDRRLRVGSDRERTMQDVFRAMNGNQRPVTQFDFLELLARAGGTELLDVGQTYTETSTSVDTWNRTTHARVFGQLPARVGYELPPVGEDDAYRISGPYRNETVDSAAVALVTGERLTVDTTVSNVGGTTGEYNVSLQVNGTTVDEAGGRIGAGESTTVPLSHRFPTPGNYVVAIDGETVNVTVERPATARVVGLSVDRTQARQGETVALTATVYNDESRPGETTVVFTRDFAEVGRQRVTVPADDRTFVRRQITLSRAGVVSLGAGSVRPVKVDVEPAPVRTTTVESPDDASLPAETTATADETTVEPTSPATATTDPATDATTDGDGPGFGTVPALLAGAVVAALLSLLRRHRRRR